MKTLTANITETLEDWFESHGLEIKAIAIKKDNDGKFAYAIGEFFPVAFCRDTDGARLKILYQLEIALIDERFENTELFFETNKKFSIQ